MLREAANRRPSRSQSELAAGECVTVCSSKASLLKPLLQSKGRKRCWLTRSGRCRPLSHRDTVAWVTLNSSAKAPCSRPAVSR